MKNSRRLVLVLLGAALAFVMLVGAGLGFNF